MTFTVEILFGRGQEWAPWVRNVTETEAIAWKAEAERHGDQARIIEVPCTHEGQFVGEPCEYCGEINPEVL